MVKLKHKAYDEVKNYADASSTHGISYIFGEWVIFCQKGFKSKWGAYEEMATLFDELILVKSIIYYLL